MEERPLASLELNRADVRRARVYPEEPYPFQSTLRGRRYAPYKPFLAFGLGIVLTFLFIFLVVIAFFALLAVALPDPMATFESLFGTAPGTVTVSSSEIMARMDTSNPLILAFLMITIIPMAPAFLLANRIVFGQRPGTLFSVTGKIRPGLIGMGALFATLVVIMQLGVAYAANPDGFVIHPRPDFWVAVLVILLLVPAQSATEELVFRGWTVQTVGSLFKSPRVAFVVASLLSSVVFTALHMSKGILSSVSLFLFSLTLLYLVWISGGIELGIGFHVANNVIILIFDAASGGSTNSLASNVELGPGELVMSIVFYLLFAGACTWYVNRQKKEKRLVSYGVPQMVTMDEQALLELARARDAEKDAAYEYASVHPFAENGVKPPRP